MFGYLDGNRSGAKPGYERLPVVTSGGIVVTKIDLSKDQVCFLDIVWAEHIRECPPDLAVKDPGALSHSR